MTAAENPCCRMEYVVNQCFHSSQIQCKVECEIQAECEDTTRDLNILHGEVLGTFRAGSNQNTVWGNFVTCCGCKYIGNGTSKRRMQTQMHFTLVKDCIVPYYFPVWSVQCHLQPIQMQCRATYRNCTGTGFCCEPALKVSQQEAISIHKEADIEGLTLLNHWTNGYIIISNFYITIITPWILHLLKSLRFSSTCPVNLDSPQPL